MEEDGCSILETPRGTPTGGLNEMPQDRLPNCNRGMQRILRIRPRATRREQTRRSWIFVRTIELDLNGFSG